MHARRKLSVWPGAEEIACTQSAPRPWHGAGIAGTVQARGLRSGVKSGRSPKADAAAHLLKERRIIGVPRVVLPHNLKLCEDTHACFLALRAPAIFSRLALEGPVRPAQCAPTGRTCAAVSDPFGGSRCWYARSSPQMSARCLPVLPRVG
jgi:hypothetical protein